MNSKIENIIEDLKSLSLLEAAELVKQIEDVFGVDASISTSGMVLMDTNPSSVSRNDEEEVKTEFDAVLEEVPSSKKIAILKVVRSLTGLGLIEAKSLVESAPKVVKEALSKDEAENVKKKLEEAGAVVTIK